MNQKIIQAIVSRNLVQFDYDGGIRIVEPHCYGLTPNGIEGLRAFQVGGYSSTGKMGWKMFYLTNATSIDVLEDSFESPRPGYSRGDKGMNIIHAEI
jgi:hypothetical protein